jgi:hypothetical protein
MTKTLHLWPEEITQSGDDITTGFTLEGPDEGRKSFWYRLPAAYRDSLAPSCDPYVLAALFPAMTAPADLVVHGSVSPSLLYNLMEYQSAWVMWERDRYASIDIRADSEAEQPMVATSAAVAGFSGGLDSSFTVYRHRQLDLGRTRQNLTSAIHVHGIDIPLSEKEAYQRANARVRRMLDSLGVAMIPMAMNLKEETKHIWYQCHGAMTASCLMLLSGGFSAGLLAASYPYSNIMPGWGSNPVTDWRLGSNAFPIIHDGAGYTRFDKIQVISQWPGALENLRVCMAHMQGDTNCCRCRKCMRTILLFRFAGCGLPPCF